MIDATTIDRCRTSGTGLRHPLDAARTIRGVLFDVDGTLYRQAPLRAAMAVELSLLPLLGPFKARRTLAALRAYRRAQENARTSGQGVTPRSQLDAAVRASGFGFDEVERLVERWMFERPLKYLRYCQAPGLQRVLDLLAGRGVRLGVLTDYRPKEKLEALGLTGRFSLVLCTSDAAIGCFKPHPRGFLYACEQWDIAPSDVLMVGDRVEVDAAGAAAAGMSSVIVGRPSRAPLPANCVTVPSFERLCDVFDRCA